MIVWEERMNNVMFTEGDVFLMENGDDDVNIIYKIVKEWVLDVDTLKLGRFDDLDL